MLSSNGTYSMVVGRPAGPVTGSFDADAYDVLDAAVRGWSETAVTVSMTRRRARMPSWSFAGTAGGGLLAGIGLFQLPQHVRLSVPDGSLLAGLVFLQPRRRPAHGASADLGTAHLFADPGPPKATSTSGQARQHRSGTTALALRRSRPACLSDVLHRPSSRRNVHGRRHRERWRDGLDRMAFLVRAEAGCQLRLPRPDRSLQPRAVQLSLVRPSITR